MSKKSSRKQHDIVEVEDPYREDDYGYWVVEVLFYTQGEADKFQEKMLADAYGSKLARVSPRKRRWWPFGKAAND